MSEQVYVVTDLPVTTEESAIAPSNPKFIAAAIVGTIAAVGAAYFIVKRAKADLQEETSEVETVVIDSNPVPPTE